jgi:hypothetical protein
MKKYLLVLLLLVPIISAVQYSQDKFLGYELTSQTGDELDLFSVDIVGRNIYLTPKFEIFRYVDRCSIATDEKTLGSIETCEEKLLFQPSKMSIYDESQSLIGSIDKVGGLFLINTSSLMVIMSITLLIVILHKKTISHI